MAPGFHNIQKRIILQWVLRKRSADFFRASKIFPKIILEKLFVGLGKGPGFRVENWKIRVSGQVPGCAPGSGPRRKPGYKLIVSRAFANFD